MPGKTAYFHAKHFAKKGDFDSSGIKCRINDSIYRKGETLEDCRVAEAVKYCKQYGDRDINTVIVKEDRNMTIWLEEKLDTICETPENQSPALETLPTEPRLPTKRVTKRYRGQVYEEEVIDWAAMQQMNQQKPRRKYRGQYID